MSFQNCLIVSDATGLTRSPIAIMFDDASVEDAVEDIVFESCRIIAIGGTSSTSATAFRHDLKGFVKLVECDLSAANTKVTTPAAATGVTISEAIVIGGVISTSSKADKETEVWDMLGTSPNPSIMSGTNMSKWKGPVEAAGRKAAVTQRTIDADAKDVDGILLEEPLTGSEQPDVLPDFQPDVYRVLSVTGNQLFMNQDVYIIGKDWADNQITDKITLDDTDTVEGVKPFKSVTKIILPAQNNTGEKVKVGTTNKLGLYFPLSAQSDVIQWTKKASADTSYTVQSLGAANLIVDEVYATVEPTAGITDDDSFEWALLTSP